MSDLIKRSDAIDAIEDLPNCYNGFSDTYDKAYIIGTLEEVPSAERKGKWILHQDSRTWECSECHKYQVIWSNYCMHCGTDMRGEEDD